MALLNFPNPVDFQTYTANGNTWEWNGTSWISANNLNLSDQVTGVLGTVYGGTGKALSGMTVGSVIYADTSSSFAALAPGTSNYVLATQGNGSAPYWKIDDSGTGSVGNGNTGGFAYYTGLNSITSSTGVSYISTSNRIVLTNQILSMPSSVIDSGIWAGTAISLTNGGTNGTRSGIGVSYELAVFNSAGTAITQIETTSSIGNSILLQVTQDSYPIWVGQSSITSGYATSSQKVNVSLFTGTGTSFLVFSDVRNGTASLGTTGFITINASTGTIGATTFSGNATTATSAGSAGTAVNAGAAGTAVNAGLAATSTNAGLSQKVNLSLYTGTGTSFLVFSDVSSGTASLGSTGFITINASTGTIGATTFSGNATTATSAGSAGTAVNAGAAGTAVNAGLAVTSTNAGSAFTSTNSGLSQKVNLSLYTGAGTSFLVFSDVSSGTASLGSTGFITINASTGTIGATTFSGNATTATSAGSAGTAVNAGAAGTAVNAGLAVTSTNAGLSQKVNLSLYTGTGTSFLVFSDVSSGTASLGSTGFITINASTGTIGATTFSGNATTATSAGSAGTAVNAGAAGTAVNAGLAVTSTNAGLSQKVNLSLYTGTGTSFLVFSDVRNGTASLGSTGFITINASTGTIGATTFSGNATTATVSGSSEAIRTQTLSGVNYLTLSSSNNSSASQQLFVGSGISVTSLSMVVPLFTRIGDGTNSFTSSTGSLVVSGGVGVSGNLNIGGDLTVNGTTVTVNSTVTTVVDPIMTIGTGIGGTVPNTADSKDRGVAFYYFSGSGKTGFFGWDQSELKYALYSDATINSEIVTGTKATLIADLDGLAGYATSSQKVNVSLYTGTGTSFLVFSDVRNGTASLGTTGFITINASTGTIGATTFSGNATTATSAGSAGTAVNAGAAGTAVNAGLAVTSTNAGLSQKVNLSLYTGTGTSFLVFSDVSSGTASLGSTGFITINASTGTIGATTFSGNATTATSAGSAGTAVNAGAAGTAVNAGLAVTSTNAGLSQKVNVSLYTGAGTSFLVFSDVRNGTASLGSTGFITINASTGTIGATTFSGNATTATSAGSAGTAVNAGAAGTAINAGLAVTSTNAGSAFTSTNSGLSQKVNLSLYTGAGTSFLVFSDVSSGTASLGSTGFITINASTGTIGATTFSGNATTATSAGSAGTAVNAGAAGTAVNAGLAVTSTNAGLAQKVNLSLYTGTGTSFLVFSDVKNGTSSLGSTGFITINASTGTIGATSYTGTWTGTAVTALYGGTGLASVSKLDVLTGASSGNSWIAIGSTFLPSAYIGEFAPPALAAYGATQPGQLWWDSTYGVLKVYYADTNTNQWVDALPVLGSNGGSAVKRSYLLSFGAGFTPSLGSDTVSILVPFAPDNSVSYYYIKRLELRNEGTISGAGASFFIERNTTRTLTDSWTTANTIFSAAGSSFKAGAGIYITSYTNSGSGASFVSSSGVAASIMSGDYLRLNFTALNGAATLSVSLMIEEQ
jgi:hypothetical protein